MDSDSDKPIIVEETSTFERYLGQLDRLSGLKINNKCLHLNRQYRITYRKKKRHKRNVRHKRAETELI